MFNLIIGFFTTTITFCAMEFVAWFTHKYIMHGIFWNLHKDHHIKDFNNFFEKNDSFFVIFAIPSITFFILSLQVFVFFWIGLGILLYGMAYFFVHDIFIHQRFKVLRQTNNPYLRAIRKAHKIHHKHRVKENGECFGMLLVPFKYLKEAGMIQKNNSKKNNK